MHFHLQFPPPPPPPKDMFQKQEKNHKITKNPNFLKNMRFFPVLRQIFSII
jgi:hypothetical protein